MGFGWNLGNSLDAYIKDTNEGLNSEQIWEIQKLLKA